MNIFNEDGLIDSDVQDILYELGNVGLGMASVTIGRMLGMRLQIGVPKVVQATEVVPKDIEEYRDKVLIVMRFQKSMSGYMVVLLKKEFAGVIVEKLTSRCEDVDEEDKKSAFAEFGNFVCAAYLKAVGQYTGIRFYVKPVECCMDISDKFPGRKPECWDKISKRAICVDAGFNIKQEDKTVLEDVGNIIMLPFEESVEALIEPLL